MLAWQGVSLVILGGSYHQGLLYKTFSVHAGLTNLSSLKRDTSSLILIQVIESVQIRRADECLIGTSWTQESRRLASETASKLRSTRLETLKDMDPR